MTATPDRFKIFSFSVMQSAFFLVFVLRFTVMFATSVCVLFLIKKRESFSKKNYWSA